MRDGKGEPGVWGCRGILIGAARCYSRTVVDDYAGNPKRGFDFGESIRDAAGVAEVRLHVDLARGVGAGGLARGESYLVAISYEGFGDVAADVRAGAEDEGDWGSHCSSVERMNRAEDVDMIVVLFFR